MLKSEVRAAVAKIKKNKFAEPPQRCSWSQKIWDIDNITEVIK